MSSAEIEKSQVDIGFNYERMQERRKSLGMSQGDLAEKVGIAQNQISRYERGHVMPSAEALAKITHALETNADYLLGLSDSAHPVPPSDLTYSEIELINLLRGLDPATHRQFVDAIKALRAAWDGSHTDT